MRELYFFISICLLIGGIARAEEDGPVLEDPAEYRQELGMLSATIEGTTDSLRQAREEDSRTNFAEIRANNVVTSLSYHGERCKYVTGSGQLINYTDGGSSTCTPEDWNKHHDACQSQVEKIDYCTKEMPALQKTLDEAKQTHAAAQTSVTTLETKLNVAIADKDHLEKFGPGGGETVGADNLIHVIKSYWKDINAISLIPDRDKDPKNTVVKFKTPINFMDDGHAADGKVTLNDDQGCTYIFSGSASNPLTNNYYQISADRDAKPWDIVFKNPETRRETTSTGCQLLDPSLQTDCGAAVQKSLPYDLKPSVILKSENPELRDYSLRIEADSSETVVKCLRQHGYAPDKVYVKDDFARTKTRDESGKDETAAQVR